MAELVLEYAAELPRPRQRLDAGVWLEVGDGDGIHQHVRAQN